MSEKTAVKQSLVSDSHVRHLDYGRFRFELTSHADVQDGLGFDLVGFTIEEIERCAKSVNKADKPKAMFFLEGISSDDIADVQNILDAVFISCEQYANAVQVGEILEECERQRKYDEVSNVSKPTPPLIPAPPNTDSQSAAKGK